MGSSVGSSVGSGDGGGTSPFVAVNSTIVSPHAPRLDQIVPCAVPSARIVPCIVWSIALPVQWNSNAWSAVTGLAGNSEFP